MSTGAKGRRDPAFAAAVLAGGESRRMGRPKAWLEFGRETLLQRIVRILREAADPVVVVAAEKQELPELPPEVLVLRDDRPGLGPLMGLLVGLRHLRGAADRVYASGCDAPLLGVGFARAVAEALRDHDAAVPFVDGRYHPLAAAYRPEVSGVIEELLEAGESRPRALFSRVRTRRLQADDLRDADPDLHALLNCNRPEDYRAALGLLGISREDGRPKRPDPDRGGG